MTTSRVTFSPEVRNDIADEYTRHALDTFEDGLERWYGHYERAAEDSKDVALQRRLEKQSTTAVVLYQTTRIAARIIGLSEALIDIVNNHYVYGAMPISRALHEQCCVPCYMADQIVPRLRKQRTNDVVRLLFRLGLGTGPTGHGFIRPIKVGSLNAAADRYVTAWAKRNFEDDPAKDLVSNHGYGMLSDVTHPNWRALNPMAHLPGEPHELRPRLDLETLMQIIASPVLLLLASGYAISDCVLAALDHPLEYQGMPEWEDGDVYPNRPQTLTMSVFGL